MKRRTLGIALAPLAALTLNVAPAHAASYTIVGSQVFFGSATVWAAEGCPEAWVNTPANGIDSRVVNVQGLAGRQVSYSWSGVAPIGNVGGGLTVRYYSVAGATCGQIVPANQFLGGGPQSGTLNIPGNAKWALFEATYIANVTITF
ncbi:MAG: hypothetical protein QOK43_888 [Acidimicrobiaceae bacterium]|nr:hypothetical protein [Acidimicrobiaceae bacterium]